VSAVIGVVLFAGGLHGYLLTTANLWQRALLVVGGFCLIKPGSLTDLIGIALATIVIVAQVMARRAAEPKVEIAAE
jgi:TRAP-type uncharacterized transport system fused permease subunit